MTDTQLDVVISNCDINLSVDKPTVHRDVPRTHTGSEGESALLSCADWDNGAPMLAGQAQSF
jgi:hypothetical protein